MPEPSASTIGIIGAGEVGSHIARAAIASGYRVVIANSRGPETLKDLVAALGPRAQAATAAEVAAAGDFVVVAVPLKPVNDMPEAELAGKVVIDTNNYMPWRDEHYPIVDSGEKTEHEQRQAQLPNSKVVKAFTHIQAPRILSWSRPAGAADRAALTASSDFPEAVAVVTRLYDQFGFDTVDNSPLSESWRTGPGQPAWKQEHHTRGELIENLTRARRASDGSSDRWLRGPMILDAALSIRPMTERDLPAALAIQSHTYPAFLIDHEAAFASRIEMAASYCLAADRDGKLVGYLLAHGWPSQSPPPVGAILPSEAASEMLFIHDLAVGPAGRGFGLGSQLVARAFDLAAGAGLHRAELIAVHGAAPYWRTLGFVEHEPLPTLAAKVAAYGPNARWMTRKIGAVDQE